MENADGKSIKTNRIKRERTCFCLVKKSWNRVTQIPNKKTAPLTQSRAARLAIPSAQLLRFSQFVIPKADKRFLEKVIIGLPDAGLLTVESWFIIGESQLFELAATTKTMGKTTRMIANNPMAMRRGMVIRVLANWWPARYTIVIIRLAMTRKMNILLVKSPIPVSTDAISSEFRSSSWSDLYR